MPQRRRRPQQRTQQTRKQLLDAAWDLVRGQGEQQLTIRALAQRAGVSQGLPNRHFGDRDGLLDELRVRVWDELDTVIAQAVGPSMTFDATSDYEALVVEGVHAAVSYAHAEPHLFDLLALGASKRPSDRILLRQMETTGLFTRMFAAGQAHGFFRPNADPMIATMALWSGILGYNLWARAHTPAIMRSFNVRVLDELLTSFFTRNCVAKTPLRLLSDGVSGNGKPEP